MTFSIYKYPLTLKFEPFTLVSASGEQTLSLPKNTRVLAVQTQGYDLMLWAFVNPEETVVEQRTFRVIGTGHDIPSQLAKRLKYIATAQIGVYVWHVFEQSV